MFSKRDLLAVVPMALAINPVLAQPPGLAAKIADYTKAHNFSGSVLVTRGGRAVYRHSFGIADRAFGIPATDGTKYRIASITKAFTSVLVLQLMEQGKTDLDGTIARYLPD